MGLLSWYVVIPAATALAITLVPKEKPHLIRWVGAVGGVLLLMLSAIVSVNYMSLASADAEVLRGAMFTKLYMVEQFKWFETLGIEYFVGVDGISVLMLDLTALIIFTGVLASWYVVERPKEFFALLFTLVTGVFGVFISFDLFLFFVFYEIAVLPMYLLIGIWGTGNRNYSALKLTLMLLAGSAAILVGILAFYHQSGLHTFNLIELSRYHFPLDFQRWVFPMVFLGFGVLGALYPFHTWSPDGHASAPTAVSMLHAGVLMKLGGYGCLRIAIYLMPQGAIEWAMFFMALATVNILYGALGAIQQKDLKYFTAYSSVSHCGFVLFGLVALNLMGIKGAVIQMFSHGIMTGLFFGLIGMVYGRTHTRMIPEMGGLAKVMPWLAASFYIAGLASLGLPGLSGFIAESHVFLGGFFGNQWHNLTLMRTLTVLATMSVVVTAVYVLRGLARVFHSTITNPEFEKLTDATFPEKLSTGILLGTLAIGGMLPWLFVDLIEGSIYPILNRLHESGMMSTLQPFAGR
jgi:NADH-quinone oxidoreductase subunit M